MFLESTTTIFVEAMKLAFDAEHPFEDGRSLSVHTEYPLDEVSYPGFWVNFVPQGDVRNVGIGHIEYYSDDTGDHRAFRWNFSGVCEITVAALSSLERARMVDWLVKTIAFGRPGDVSGPLVDFRQHVDTNDLIGLRVLWESFVVGGSAETPGTPWGGDDVVYEMTVSLSVEGEYLFDPDRAVLVPLSAIALQEPEIAVVPVASPSGSDGWL